jgi:hypothetical protein
MDSKKIIKRRNKIRITINKQVFIVIPIIHIKKVQYVRFFYSKNWFNFVLTKFSVFVV